ncbi:lipopolysaccharide assembly LapA domain-containing protein [Sporosarcina siberiensis]|uniref:Lipopolysaccharide assembly LapA domain-containing protein n=1 Tax=Sporosarcina siberiensis TaxID=1365606 RepID=A0ABW4SFD3_9BACL
MKIQWNLLLGLIFAVIIAVFAVMNVNAVPVNYVFGESEWPLVLVILCSALLGAAISIFIAMFRSVQSNRRIKELLRENNEKEIIIANQQNELAELQKTTGEIIPQDIRVEDITN